eukprot:3168776-Rhodomonas_salina.1
MQGGCPADVHQRAALRRECAALPCLVPRQLAPGEHHLAPLQHCHPAPLASRLVGLKSHCLPGLHMAAHAAVERAPVLCRLVPHKRHAPPEAQARALPRVQRPPCDGPVALEPRGRPALHLHRGEVCSQHRAACFRPVEDELCRGPREAQLCPRAHKQRPARSCLVAHAAHARAELEARARHKHSAAPLRPVRLEIAAFHARAVALQQQAPAVAPAG